MQLIKSALAAAGLVAMMAPAMAEPIVLTFEGVGNGVAVGNFYNGGAGTNYGVSFSPATLAIVDADAGGTGNFANEPSPNTIMFFLDANNAILNLAAGFDTGFSFFYTSATAANVTVWSGLNGTGTLLGTISLTAQYTNNCAGDPTGMFCHWDAIGVAFAGTARSINFGGTANQTGYDNITFGSDTPVGNVPEPSTYAMLGLGLAGIGIAARRRKTVA
jgi:PEP-CTERM motif